jgi:hypothetical protein
MGGFGRVAPYMLDFDLERLLVTASGGVLFEGL